MGGCGRDGVEMRSKRPCGRACDMSVWKIPAETVDDARRAEMTAGERDHDGQERETA